MKFITLLCVISCLMGFREAVAAENGEIARQLEKIVAKSGLEKSDVGISVWDSSKKKVFGLNDEKHFIPASITKLLTAAAVMARLQPDHEFLTRLYMDGDQDDSVLKGNIYLKGGGDPAFVSEKMWMLVNDFTRTGIKKITGRLIADDSYFDDERVDPGRESERNDRAYDAPVSALSFNWNSTTLYIRPGNKAGEKARVWVDPQNEYVGLDNKVVTSSSGTSLEAHRSADGERDALKVTGKIAAGSEEKHIYKNITNPPLYAGYNLRSFLKQRGIEVEGPVVTGKVPSSARMASECPSERLSRLIIDMNKFSNNFIAETLTKDLGAFATGHQGHMKDGLDEVRRFLESDVGLDGKSFGLVNVSGFTRHNSFTPRQFTDVLGWVIRQFRIYPEFAQSLPVAGVDGTLEKRFKGSQGERWIRAKTGFLNGVVALAGFAGRPDGSLFTFAFIYNGHGDEVHVREIFDRLASSLVK